MFHPLWQFHAQMSLIDINFIFKKNIYTGLVFLNIFKNIFTFLPVHISNYFSTQKLINIHIIPEHISLGSDLFFQIYSLHKSPSPWHDETQTQYNKMIDAHSFYSSRQRQQRAHKQTENPIFVTREASIDIRRLREDTKRWRFRQAVILSSLSKRYFVDFSRRYEKPTRIVVCRKLVSMTRYPMRAFTNRAFFRSTIGSFVGKKFVLSNLSIRNKLSGMWKTIDR